MFKYLYSFLICTSSLFAMEHDVPFEDGFVNTSSSSSNALSTVSSSSSQPPEEEEKPWIFAELPPEIIETHFPKNLPFHSPEEFLSVCIAMHFYNSRPHSINTPATCIEYGYKVCGLNKVYFNDSTTDILDQSYERVNNVPTILFLKTKPSVDELLKLAQKFPNIEKIILSDETRRFTLRQDIIPALGRFEKLKYLDINNSNMRPEDEQAIANTLPGLIHLDVSMSGLNADGARTIAQGLQKLTWLNISGNSVGADGARTIAQGLQKLTWLNIAVNSVGDRGLRLLSQKLINLESITLNYIDITPAAMEGVFGRGFPKLKAINILGYKTPGAGNAFGLALAQAIGEREHPRYASVTSLVMQRAGLTDEAIIDMVPHLTTLTSLDLAWGHIGSDSLRAIGHNLTNLKILTLHNNGVRTSLDDARDLIQNLPALEELYIGNVDASREEKQEFQAIWRHSPDKLNLR